MFFDTFFGFFLVDKLALFCELFIDKALSQQKVIVHKNKFFKRVLFLGTKQIYVSLLARSDIHQSQESKYSHFSALKYDEMVFKSAIEVKLSFFFGLKIV